MKTRFITKCLLLLCPIFGQQAAAQSVIWKPSPPKQQQKTSFDYLPKGGDLEFSDDAKAMILYYAGNKWHTEKIEIYKKDDTWSGDYQLPDRAVFLAIRFYQGNAEKPEAADNNNGKGYYTRVMSTHKKDVPGSYLAEAALRAGLTGDWALNSFATPIKDGRIIDSLLSKEDKLSKKELRPFLFTYLDLKRLTLSPTEFVASADRILKEEIKKGKLDEKLLAGMQGYYARLKDQQGVEMVEDLIFTNYPKSGTARQLAYRKATAGKFGNDLQLAVEDFLTKYPYSEWKKNPDTKGYIYYELFRGLGAHYYESKQIDKFLSLFKEIDFKTANEIYRWNLTKAHMLGRGDFELNYRLSKEIIPYLLANKDDQSYRPDFNDAAQIKANVEKQLNERLFTHIYMANNQADYVNGIKYFQYLSKKGLYGTADLNELHMNILEKLGDEKSIRPVLEQSVAANTVTPAMFVKLKEIYVRENNGKSTGYEKYLAALMPNDKKAELRAHVMANMVNHPLPPFILEDADGNMVDSKDFGNKTIVIDFWATWCRPCIMSFPGMQLLVDQYAIDPEVGIYMIGTMQSGDYKAKSVEFVKGEGYRFNLLHDGIGTKGEQNMVFQSLIPLFKSSGIPRKIIVRNGTVRYSSEGYSGSPSQLRDELALAIEEIKGEKKGGE